VISDEQLQKSKPEKTTLRAIFRAGAQDGAPAKGGVKSSG